MDEPSRDTTFWCAGLPFSGERALSDYERACLKARVRAERRAFQLLTFVSFALFLAMLGSLMMFDARSEGFGGVAAAVFTTLLFGTIISALRGRDALSRSRVLRGDAELGKAFVFSGVIKDIDPANDTQRELLKRGILQPGTVGTQRLEALPVSHRILSVNGAEVKPWISALWIETADSPAFAAIAADWLQPVAVTDEAEVHSGQRDLSDIERFELARTIWALGRPNWAAIIVTFWLSANAVWYGLNNEGRDAGYLLWLGIVGLVAAWVFVLHGRRLLVRRRLLADARQGIAVIVRIKTKSDANPDGSSATEREFEILAQSRVLWTEEGKPCAWRTSSFWRSVPPRMSE